MQSRGENYDWKGLRKIENDWRTNFSGNFPLVVSHQESQRNWASISMLQRNVMCSVHSSSNLHRNQLRFLPTRYNNNNNLRIVWQLFNSCLRSGVAAQIHVKFPLAPRNESINVRYTLSLFISWFNRKSSYIKHD